MDKIKTLVLSGGIGGSRFLKGLQLLPELEITAVINNGDDITMHGLRICPDIDSVIYNLANISNTVNGWGRSEETWAVQKELEFYSGRPTWFNLGDKDFATHIYRTQNLAAGEKLHKIISNIVELRKIKIKILPSTDDIVETQVLLRDNHEGRNSMHFQEWWVKFRGNLQVLRAWSYLPHTELKSIDDSHLRSSGAMCVGLYYIFQKHHEHMCDP